ncbi:MAG: hypothetical protein BroJett040_05260 [Oligoflexia bacterium]|nr:MAG: hypothetical protein BroJett040_05260 [Oligoflexia bacterium]
MSKKRPQQQLLDEQLKVKKEFGGSLLKKSHAKTSRPISTKQAMHLTLRSSLAKGERSFLATRVRSKLIEEKIRINAKKFGVQIYRYANVGNHLHLLVRPTYRRGFISFLRAISGVIARIALGVERGQARSSEASQLAPESIQFWDQRPWTRVLAWMADFINVRKYVNQNFNEAMGFLPYRPRKYSSTA